MHVVSIVGARPQFVKAAPLSAALRPRHLETLVHTGQHWDATMSDAFFVPGGLRTPDHHLGVRGGPRGETISATIAALEPVLRSLAPDAAIVFGDTNATAAGATAAALLGIPVVHVEAGLRSGDRRMPEELNRILVDRLATLRCCPTETAVAHLAAEGIHDGVHLVGDVQRDALERSLASPDGTTDIAASLGLERGAYAVATIHRVENTDDPQRLRDIADAMGRLDIPVALPLHPRTRHAADAHGITFGGRIRLIEPLPHVQLLQLSRHARVIITDSGGLQKEAYWLGVPCVTVRTTTEWVETVAAGWNRLCEPAELAAAVAHATVRSERPPVLGPAGASRRIVALLDLLPGSR